MAKKRKPGGGRKKSKPDYNPSAVLQNQMDAAVALYSTADHPSLQAIADELDLKRNKQKYDTKPVTVNLLSANRKISNMIFSLNFYQKDAVSTNREAATYQVYFTDEDGKQISDIQKIIADKTSDNGAERTFRCQFNLKSLKYSNTATYYLVIADEQGLQLPQREPFQIDIAFAVDEFDFFS